MSQTKRIVIPPLDVTKQPIIKEGLKKLADQDKRTLSDYVRLVLLRHVLDRGES